MDEIIIFIDSIIKGIHRLVLVDIVVWSNWTRMKQPNACSSFCELHLEKRNSQICEASHAYASS